MGWLGKLVGGTIGFAIGGPLGAVCGAAVGHGFDKSDEQYLGDQEGLRLSNDEQSQLTFFVAAFSMLAKLSKADGRISEEEIASIDQFMARDLGLTAETQKIAIDVFRSATRSPESFESFAIQFYTTFRSQPEILELMIDILFRVSVADNHFSAKEEAMIRSAARIFHFSEDAYLLLKSRYVRAEDRAFAILGVDRNDPDDVIKKRYRKLVLENHPDKVMAKGLPEEFTKLAHDKFREIQESYETIKKMRGLN